MWGDIPRDVTEYRAGANEWHQVKPRAGGGRASDWDEELEVSRSRPLVFPCWQGPVHAEGSRGASSGSRKNHLPSRQW